jgi:hypothetical protein
VQEARCKKQDVRKDTRIKTRLKTKKLRFKTQEPRYKKIEGNAGLWTINLMNELSYYASPRFSINPSFTFMASVEDFDLSGRYWQPVLNGENTESFVASLFTDVRFQYDVIKTEKDFRLGIGFGLSFQYGGD